MHENWSAAPVRSESLFPLEEDADETLLCVSLPSVRHDHDSVPFLEDFWEERPLV